MEKINDIDISVVIPIYNEEKIISELYRRLHLSVSEITNKYEFIFVNDGSIDNSQLELQKLAEKDDRVFYINFSRNFGHQIAVIAGLDNVKGKSCVIIDGDLQDPPELIVEMYKKYKEGYDVVYAKRTKREGESLFKKVTAKMFYRILRNITEIDIPLDTGDFRLIDRKIVNLIIQMKEQNKFIRGQIAWVGFKQTFVEFKRDERTEGKTGYPLSKMLRFSLDGITGFSDKPLKLLSQAGIILSFVSLLTILYALFSHFILKNTIQGWTSVIICVLFVGGVQLLSLGVIGEYIIRMNNNIRDRPLYIIDSTNFNKPS